MRRWQKTIRASFVVAVVASIANTGFLSNLWMTTTNTVGIFPLTPVVSERKPSKQTAQIWLGIACSEEEQKVILDTYLANNSSHAFANPCPFEYQSHSSDCQTRYKFFPSSSSIQTWLHYAFENGPSNARAPIIILWVPSGSTVIYPPYFNEYLSSQGLGSEAEVLLGDTPKVDCRTVGKGQRKRIDNLACQKLSGELSLLSYQALRMLVPKCAAKEGKDSSVTTSLNEVIRSCGNDIAQSLQVSFLPRQFDKPTTEGFLSFWERLVEWNSFPFRVEYITAKFSRNQKWASEVRLARTLLLSNGYNPRQIHAYYDFPDFIRDDTRWQPHLEFLHNDSLKPKGGGYWFWKAPLLLYRLQKMEQGDIVVYADADLHDQWKWLPWLFEEMVATNTSLALYAVDYKDQNYTKRDVYSYYCGSRDQTKDHRWQYAAGLVVVRKTPGVVGLLEKWQLGMQNFTMLNDSPSTLPNHAGFRYHLHDQSILSVLVKCWYHDAYEARKTFDGAVTLADWSVEMFDP